MNSKKIKEKIMNLKSQLAQKDYIGRKIAEVLLTGTDAEINAIRIEYAKDIVEARNLRLQINELDAQLTEAYLKEEEERERLRLEEERKKEEQMQKNKIAMENFKKKIAERKAKLEEQNKTWQEALEEWKQQNTVKDASDVSSNN